jgi:hypothetical protein
MLGMFSIRTRRADHAQCSRFEHLAACFTEKLETPPRLARRMRYSRVRAIIFLGITLHIPAINVCHPWIWAAQIYI